MTTQNTTFKIKQYELHNRSSNMFTKNLVDKDVLLRPITLSSPRTADAPFYHYKRDPANVFGLSFEQEGENITPHIVDYSFSGGSSVLSALLKESYVWLTIKIKVTDYLEAHSLPKDTFILFDFKEKEVVIPRDFLFYLSFGKSLKNNILMTTSEYLYINNFYNTDRPPFYTVVSTNTEVVYQCLNAVSFSARNLSKPISAEKPTNVFKKAITKYYARLHNQADGLKLSTGENVSFAFLSEDAEDMRDNRYPPTTDFRRIVESAYSKCPELRSFLKKSEPSSSTEAVIEGEVLPELKNLNVFTFSSLLSIGLDAVLKVFKEVYDSPFSFSLDQDVQIDNVDEITFNMYSDKTARVYIKYSGLGEGVSEIKSLREELESYFSSSNFNLVRS